MSTALWLLLPALAAAAEFHNHGTRPEVTKSFDCEARAHALRFARGTLPERGQFRTAFEALQLEACGLPIPSEYDSYTPPQLPPPHGGLSIWADPSADPKRADGSPGAPFATLEAAVAAAKRPGGATIMLRAGTYYTAGVLITAEHSNLTIQNAAGAQVVVSGAVPLPNSKPAWSLHDQRTNTWRLDLSAASGLPGRSLGLRVGGLRAIRAKFPNGANPEVAVPPL